ncbi:regulator of microtubule dynamics protein 2-like [Haemaphysalis longicornis]
MDGLVRDRLTMLAALGTGVVVGLSGIYLYYRLNRSVSRELSSLAGSIADLRRQIEQLRTEERREAPLQAQSLPLLQNSLRSDDDEDDEYYDFTDVEDASWTGLREAGDEGWFESLDAALDRPGDKQALLTAMLGRESQYSRSAGFFWRLAKASHLYNLQQKLGRGAKEELAREAFCRAQRALQLDESCPEAHKWFAITLGALSEYVGTQEKIENGYRFKEHVDRAVRLKPQDPTLHHMLGRWSLEVATLSWIERKLASALYSRPPESSPQEARAHLLEADKLRPNWKENLLYIAKTYICEGHYAPAMAWLDRAAKLPSVDPGDDSVHKEVENLQEQYQRYRP